MLMRGRSAVGARRGRSRVGCGGRSLTTRRAQGFESAFDAVDGAAKSLIDAANSLLKAAKAHAKASASGDVVRIRSTAQQLPDLAEATRASAVFASNAWPFSEDEEQKYLEGPFETELVKAATGVGVRITRIGDQLAAFPSLIRVLPQRRAIRVAGKQLPTLRPVRLAALLKANQDRKPTTRPEAFLETLFGAYSLVVGSEHPERGAKLADIYQALTLLPEARRSYDKAQFALDVYTLDQSGVKKTRSGHEVRFPAATATKSSTGVFNIVSPEGEVVSFYGIRFHKGSR